MIKGLKEHFRIVSKDNLDEFGVGRETTSSLFGKHTFPADVGGSSGGGALALYLGETDVALGSDTGGSIRDVTTIFSSMLGFKPSRGMLSRSGMIAHSNPMDTPGLLAYDAELLSLAFEASARYRTEDETATLPLQSPKRLRQAKAHLSLKHRRLRCGSTGKEYRVACLDSRLVSRIYHYYSSVYLYSNLMRFSVKSFTGSLDLSPLSIRADELPFNRNVGPRFLWGLTYLRMGQEYKRLMDDRLNTIKRLLVLLLHDGSIIETSCRDAAHFTDPRDQEFVLN